jgi:hypothetical protein|tara:strand:+ start:2637 stop:3185 length:549 start_codon:yes stop_codon:yes gene_type:complete
MAYANGKYAIFISDRSGLQFPYKEMVTEWNGAKVHTSEWEKKAPQIMPQEHVPDAIPLLNPRVDRVAPVTTQLLSINPFRFTAGSTTVQIFMPGHPYTTSSTIMFWNAANSGTEGTTTQFQGMGVKETDRFGVPPSELMTASGFVPSSVTEDFINITITSTPTASGPGGGGVVFIGPTTVTA